MMSSRTMIIERQLSYGRQLGASIGAGMIAWLCAGCGAAPEGTLSGGEEVSASSEAIEGGQLENPGFPAVGYTGCTATLLSPTIALGAAHGACGSNNLMFAVGSNDSDYIGYHVDATVRTPFKDLLLMHLRDPVPNAATLTINPGAYPAVGEQCTIVGFGAHHDESGTLTDGTSGTGHRKRSAIVKVDSIVSTVDDPRIKVNWVTGLTNGGDSGGPLICGGMIAGVLKSGTSWPYSPTNSHASYTAVDPAWIAANIGVAPPTVSNSLYLEHGSELYRVDDSLGNSQKISSPADDWSGTTSMVSMGGYIYAIQSGYLTRIDPNDGSYALIGNQDWPGPTTLTALNGSLYATQGSGLWKIYDLTNGGFYRLGDTDWTNATSMTTVGGSLYIIQDERLYKVSAINGYPVQLGGADWSGVTSMAVIDSTLYVQQYIGIWRITDRSNGRFERVGTTDWHQAVSLTALNGFLYLIQSGYLHRIDPSSGDYVVLDRGDWNNSEIMTALP